MAGFSVFGKLPRTLIIMCYLVLWHNNSMNVLTELLNLVVKQVNPECVL